MRVVAISQARYGSSRLPGKVLQKIDGVSLLQMHLERAARACKIDKLILATTFEEEADQIVALSKSLGVEVFRGSTNDVLDRYYQAICNDKPDLIVRITSDCPLIDPELIDKVIDAAIEGDYDYCSNCLEPTYPDGVDVEVIKFCALETAWRNAELPSEREHVTSYIWKNSTFFSETLFSSCNVRAEHDFSRYRLTVDEPLDLKLIAGLVSLLGYDKHWKDYIDCLEQNENLASINGFIKRNEGYMKSIENDLTFKSKNINNYAKSDYYRSKIHSLIPGGAHTYSKGDDQFPQVAPAAIDYGKGAYVWDIDGNKFLDCSMGLTSVSLGHAYPEVINRVAEELHKGVNFQRPSKLEMIIAEKFLSLVPQHQMIKFGKNGSLVITAAIKLARAYTGRKIVAFPSDHPFYSYDDWFIGTTPADAGIPEEYKTLSLRFKSCDLNSVEALFERYPGQIACIVSEPEKNHCGNSCNCALSVGEYLQKLIALCHKNGALYIQDEMVTGFKTDFPGSITKYNLHPDMATWGKGIANGFSFCALTGKKEVMELGGITNVGKEKVFLISTTHGGETTAIAAALATIEEFQQRNVLHHNLDLGSYFVGKMQDLIKSRGMDPYIGVVPCNWVPLFNFFDRDGLSSAGLRTLMMQEMIARGILFQGAFVPCFSHTKSDVDYFVDCFADCISVYSSALDEGYQKFLIGEPVKPVFRKFI